MDRTNVVLFPKTVDFYQIELTRMLETERYGEAIGLLRFLLECESGDPALDGEWRALHDWLLTMTGDQTTVDVDQEETEEQLLREHLRQRGLKDQQYVDSLVKVLQHNDSADKRLLALEQLAYVEDPGLNEKLAEWAENTEMPPQLQFKMLQTLRLRGVTGRIVMERHGRKLAFDIEKTPLTMNEYPRPVHRILELVRARCGVHDPTLAYFAEQTWSEFLAFLYGTPEYGELVALGEEDAAVWAAALHAVLQRSIQGEADFAAIKDEYGIGADRDLAGQRALQQLQSFAFYIR